MKSFLGKTSNQQQFCAIWNEKSRSRANHTTEEWREVSLFSSFFTIVNKTTEIIKFSKFPTLFTVNCILLGARWKILCHYFQSLTYIWLVSEWENEWKLCVLCSRYGIQNKYLHTTTTKKESLVTSHHILIISLKRYCFFLLLLRLFFLCLVLFSWKALGFIYT